MGGKICRYPSRWIFMLPMCLQAHQPSTCVFDGHRPLIPLNRQWMAGILDISTTLRIWARSATHRVWFGSGSLFGGPIGLVFMAMHAGTRPGPKSEYVKGNARLTPLLVGSQV